MADKVFIGPEPIAQTDTLKQLLELGRRQTRNEAGALIDPAAFPGTPGTPAPLPVFQYSPDAVEAHFHDTPGVGDNFQRVSVDNRVTWGAPALFVGTPGTNGKTYALNILGGVRAVAYNAAGTTPSPSQTAFSFALYENGVDVTAGATQTWSVAAANSMLTGSGTAKTFTPGIVANYVAASGDNWVKVVVQYASQTFVATVPIAITKVGDTGTPGAAGTPGGYIAVAYKAAPSGASWAVGTQGALPTGNGPVPATWSGVPVSVVDPNSLWVTRAVCNADNTNSGWSTPTPLILTADYIRAGVAMSSPTITGGSVQTSPDGTARAALKTVQGPMGPMGALYIYPDGTTTDAHAAMLGTFGSMLVLVGQTVTGGTNPPYGCIVALNPQGGGNKGGRAGISLFEVGIDGSPADIEVHGDIIGESLALYGSATVSDLTATSITTANPLTPLVPWTRLNTYTNGWVAYAAGTDVYYMKDAAGRVSLRGLLKSGTIGAAYSMFTLPAGCRPLYALGLMCVSNNAFARVNVNTDGTVCMYNGSNASVLLDNVSFSTL